MGFVAPQGGCGVEIWGNLDDHQISNCRKLRSWTAPASQMFVIQGPPHQRAPGVICSTPAVTRGVETLVLLLPTDLREVNRWDGLNDYVDYDYSRILLWNTPYSSWGFARTRETQRSKFRRR